jgi:putative hydrolase of the HAD superfamily
MRYKHIFFDLDSTLWDFEKNSNKTLLQLIDRFSLVKKGIDTPENFIRRYKIHNERLWDLYRIDKIRKEDLRGKRFLLTMQDYGINDFQLAEDFGLAYIEESPYKTELFPFSHEILNYLKEQYTLHIITNGFQEVQHIKLEASKLHMYFDIVITSEQVGVKKPNPKIFEFALEKANALAHESIMIGDDLIVDVLGAKNVGMTAVYFNPGKKEHNENIAFEILCLSQIKQIL